MPTSKLPATPSGNIPYLDGWRGIAIFLVLLGHFGPGRFWYAGRLGVALFFVLSGLFMGRLLFVKRVPLPAFFARRITRIIPALWLYIGVMWVYASYFRPDRYQADAGELLSVLTFVSTYTLPIWNAKWDVGQLWSLNVEEHSYVYLALGTVVVAKTRGWVSASTFLTASVAAILACTVLYMTGVWQTPDGLWRMRSEVAPLGLMASAAICVWRDNGKLDWMTSKWLPLAAALVGLVSFTLGQKSAWNFSMLVAPILFAFAVNYASSFPDIIKRIMSWRVLRWFGTCSFSIYLWQGPFYHAYLHNGLPKYAGVTLGIVCGALSFYLLENPVRLYLNRKWDQFEAYRKLPVALAVPI